MAASRTRTPRSAPPQRLIWPGVLRPLAMTVAFVALYYLLPLERAPRLPLAVRLVAALLILLATSLVQLRAITTARYPVLRAVDALATTVPLFLLLFAATYYLMAWDSPGDFSTRHLTRTDALYFTVTTFTTVGFGDITATSQAARLVVTAQMFLDLLVLGLGIRALVGAVRIGRERAHARPARSGRPARPARSGRPGRPGRRATSASESAEEGR